MPTGWPGSPFNVSCNMENGGGWTVFQRRTDGSTSFYQNWTAYKEGFGDSRNLWLGNEKLHYLTNQRNYKLRFDITTSSGSAKYAEYTKFQIESESSNYTMNKLGSRSGNTGDQLSYNKGQQFSTHDRDNDGCVSFNCAEKHRSGWWHSDSWCSSCNSNSYCYNFQYSSKCKSTCTTENLNGVYNGGNGEMIFSHYHTYCNVQFVEMKIRPSS
ncbi:tenascin [Apostichopus japonicus]|uniref:Tenascin n=2 Tax=Stichopus japonicus TaxID=307972 RepID=A0A2G8LNC0_STIJA|nr:tenascin [Apostichopus japonicus]